MNCNINEAATATQGIAGGLSGILHNMAAAATAAATHTAELVALHHRFYIKDHLGNNRRVIDTDGNVLQQTDYYPFGTPLADNASSTSADLQPYKYNGKELDGVHGLNTLDYGARQYHAVIPRWDRVDPLCEKYYHASPYAYCLNNPVKYLDLFGAEPVYTMKGIYLGSTKEGFTSNILIYDGNATIDVSKMSVSQLLEKHGCWIDSFDMVRSWGYFGMSGNSQSRIWNHIISQFEGMQVYDQFFSIKKIHNSNISYRNIERASWLTTFSHTNANVAPIIEGTSIYPYESTVENIATSIIVHEWYSHGVKHLSDRSKNHSLAYKNVINFEKLWRRTSLIYKLFNIMQFEKYNRQENNKFNENPFDEEDSLINNN